MFFTFEHAAYAGSACSVLEGAGAQSGVLRVALS
jgi:hypothetical protein